MAILNLDYRKCELPPLREGRDMGGGVFRHNIRYEGKADPGIGDDIRIFGRVPSTEWWQVRGFYISDVTDAGLRGNGWEKQQLFLLQSQSTSPEADAATPEPEGPFTLNRYPEALYPVWARGWDGVTSLAWGDANGNVLYITDKDPTWSVSLWAPVQEFRVYSRGALVASGGIERDFDLHMLVDRFSDPASQFERDATKSDPANLIINENWRRSEHVRLKA